MSKRKRLDREEAITTKASQEQGMLALLRGVNVSGAKPLKMVALQKLFLDQSFHRPKTYIQSGNVVFIRPVDHSVPVGVLEAHLEQCILDEFGFDVPVRVRTKEEMETIVGRNPFLGLEGVDEKKLHVTFLSGSAHEMKSNLPSSAELDVEAFDPSVDTYKISETGHEVFIHAPTGYGKTKLNNNAIEKALKGLSATTRNWNSCNKLREMLNNLE
ncbi:hypothetical protein BDR26DRAFT_995475 [Obelidium mucronatum]|nr:hypothetical protein BDR26DRAFT_995475 [Obelidium mucronatum]